MTAVPTNADIVLAGLTGQQTVQQIQNAAWFEDVEKSRAAVATLQKALPSLQKQIAGLKAGFEEVQASVRAYKVAQQEAVAKARFALGAEEKRLADLERAVAKCEAGLAKWDGYVKQIDEPKIRLQFEAAQEYCAYRKSLRDAKKG